MAQCLPVDHFAACRDLIIDTYSPEGVDIISDAMLIFEGARFFFFLDRYGREWRGDLDSDLLCAWRLPYFWYELLDLEVWIGRDGIYRATEEFENDPDPEGPFEPNDAITLIVFAGPSPA